MDNFVTALVIGDPHFKITNVKETNLMTQNIIKTVNEKQPDFIVVLGDILDRHESIHVSPLTRAVELLSQLQQLAPLYILIGNHDLKNNRQFCSDEHPFTALKYWNNTTVVDTTFTKIIGDKKFTFVPYVPPGRFKEALNLINWEDSTCIFAHQEFKGAKMGAMISTEGDEWELSDPFIISGHIHDYQEPQTNILYTGTPIQHGYNDNLDKTISYIKFFNKNEREHERIDLKIPKKHIVRLNCEEVNTYNPDPNQNLKIIISGTIGELKAIMKHHNIELYKSYGFKIIYKDIPIEKSGVTPEVKTSDKFSVSLYNNIKDNDAMVEIYKSVFHS